jgi:hypothetical protein
MFLVRKGVFRLSHRRAPDFNLAAAWPQRCSQRFNNHEHTLRPRTSPESFSKFSSQANLQLGLLIHDMLRFSYVLGWLNDLLSSNETVAS